MRLGLHRPSLRSTSFANLPPDQASALYRSLLADVDRYLTAMEVPRMVIEAMIDTSSSDIQWIDPKMYEKSGIAPSIAEWIDASCGDNIVDWMWREVHRPFKKLTKSEIKAEVDSESRILSCEDKKFANARDAIDDKMLTEGIVEILPAKTTLTTPN
jgi:hypothetical protein